MGTTQEGVAITRADGVLRVRLAAPHRLNALTAAALTRIAAVVEGTKSDPETRVVLLTGEGRAFSSGADLTVEHGAGKHTGLAGLGSTPDPTTIDAANRLTTAITAARPPVVCGLNGVAAGVGAAIALACDVIVAARSASLMLSFAKVGLLPDGGTTVLLSASLGRHRALALSFLGEPLTAEAAAAAGLVHELHDDEQFVAALDAMAARLAAGPSQALGATKRAINAATLSDLPGALQRERASQLTLMGGAEFAEGATAFLARRAPDFVAAAD